MAWTMKRSLEPYHVLRYPVHKGSLIFAIGTRRLLMLRQNGYATSVRPSCRRGGGRLPLPESAMTGVYVIPDEGLYQADRSIFITT